MNGLKKVIRVLNDDRKKRIFVYYNVKKQKFICGPDVKLKHEYILIYYKGDKQSKITNLDEFISYADNAMNLYSLKYYGVSMTYAEKRLHI